MQFSQPVTLSKTGQLVEGYPIIIKGQNGEDTLWMLQLGCKALEIDTSSLQFMYPVSDKSVESRLFKAKAKALTTGEWVIGYPFYAEGETEQSSYWLIKINCTADKILTDGLVNIKASTIIYEKF